MQALTTDQYKQIIKVTRHGGYGLRANPRIAAALTAEANLGIRIGDVLKLRLCDIVRDGGRYRLNITEEKTGKRRTFTVPETVYSFFCDYCREQNISTHSFRKWYATDIYNASGHDIILVQQLLQHSSPTITRRYIGISEEKVEQAIANHVLIA